MLYIVEDTCFIYSVTYCCREQFAAFVAAAGSIISIFFVLQFVPRQTKASADARKAAQGRRVVSILTA